MIFHIEGKKIPIDEKLVEEYTKNTHESRDEMQLILTVMIRNISNINNTKKIVIRYSEVEIKNMLESQLKKGIY